VDFELRHEGGSEVFLRLAHGFEKTTEFEKRYLSIAGIKREVIYVLFAAG
jgi:hypothetical protein